RDLAPRSIGVARELREDARKAVEEPFGRVLVDPPSVEVEAQDETLEGKHDRRHREVVVLDGAQPLERDAVGPDEAPLVEREALEDENRLEERLPASQSRRALGLGERREVEALELAEAGEGLLERA